MTARSELDPLEDRDDPPAPPAPALLIHAPAKASIVLVCPNCQESATVVASLFARLTRDSDGSGAIALRTRAPKIAHQCDQLALGLAEGERTR